MPSKRPLLVSTLLAALLGAALPSAALAAYAQISGPFTDPDDRFEGGVYDGQFYGSGGVQRTGEWGVGGSNNGNHFLGAPWSNSQAADLATGVMRSSLMFSSVDGDPGEYQMGNYASLDDRVTFHGSGSAEFVLRLSGRFLGSAHQWYGNSMDTSLDFYSESRTNEVLGRINLAHVVAGVASTQPGTTCGRSFGANTVVCDVISMDADDVAIDLRVRIDDIVDGETFWFHSSLNVQAYAPRMGGTDFGHTARLQVAALNGVTFTSQSGAFLTQEEGPTGTVPEPASLALVLGALAATAGVGRKKRRRSA